MQSRLLSRVGDEDPDEDEGGAYMEGSLQNTGCWRRNEPGLAAGKHMRVYEEGGVLRALHLIASAH